MKALSLHQPWASLVILGAKRFETRSWQTEYRGPLAIHAANCYRSCKLLCDTEPFRSTLAGEQPVPLGAVLGVVELVECSRMEEFRLSDHMLDVSAEFQFGDFSPGRWAWRLKVLRRFERPVPMAGRLGLWECDERLLPEWKERT